ncbi:surface-adhesin E family protein [Sphingomonas bacterium]|uniref:surface-adhesin E family protein n=1 Tax=Sphingomonas bacterium TaxID=1895847 RepID=UPI0015771CB7|nr:surface-adhesin E family protein [Sphingomonas bacterium]
MIALVLAAAAAPMWVPVGMTASRLRVFVDKASLHEVEGRRQVRVRLGAPTAITGRIVLVYQDEEFDCRARQWRMLAFEAQDEDGKVVQRSTPAAAPPPLLPALDHTIGGEVARTVCAF